MYPWQLIGGIKMTLTVLNFYVNIKIGSNYCSRPNTSETKFALKSRDNLLGMSPLNGNLFDLRKPATTKNCKRTNKSAQLSDSS